MSRAHHCWALLATVWTYKICRRLPTSAGCDRKCGNFTPLRRRDPVGQLLRPASAGVADTAATLLNGENGKIRAAFGSDSVVPTRVC